MYVMSTYHHGPYEAFREWRQAMVHQGFGDSTEDTGHAHTIPYHPDIVLNITDTDIVLIRKSLSLATRWIAVSE